MVGVFDMTCASTGASEKTLKRVGMPYEKVGWLWVLLVELVVALAAVLLAGTWQWCESVLGALALLQHVCDTCWPLPGLWAPAQARLQSG